ncbi:hypothetical protein F4775DRAFT_560515 [Biscogniauxia sp. FL1348]|nr:hypothetical protein F4775DRAFT_560515 [Biscogniauxia sp. FL1348]
MSTHTIYPDVPLYDSDGEGDTQFLWDYPFDARTPKNTIFSIDTGEFASGWIGASLDVSGQDRLNQLDSQVLPQLEQDTYCLPTPMVTRSPSRDQETTIGPSPSNSNQYISEISGPCSLSSDTILSDTLSCSPSSDITSYNTTPPTNSNATLQIVQYSPTRTRKKSKPNRSRITKPQIRREGPCALTARLDVLKLDTSPKTSVKRDENGKVAGTVAVFGLNQVVRAPIDNELRLATTITRRVGACSRCRRHRLRVNHSLPAIFSMNNSLRLNL